MLLILLKIWKKEDEEIRNYREKIDDELKWSRYEEDMIMKITEDMKYQREDEDISIQNRRKEEDLERQNERDENRKDAKKRKEFLEEVDYDFE